MPGIETFTPTAQAQRRQLVDIAANTPWFMAALQAARELGLASWCIGAGAVRNLVWDALHGYQTASACADIDFAYFDAAASSPAHDAALQMRLNAALPGLPWEVTNQALVHQWFQDCFGHAVAPLRSLEEAIASWPEFATSVGLRLEADDSLTVIAPHGLDDLFAMVVRRNPTRVSVDTYRRRLADKRYAERWPMVSIMPC